MDNFSELYDKLVFHDMEEQLPGEAVEKFSPLSDDEVRQLIGYSSVLSISTDYEKLALAYEIVTRIIEIKKDSDEYVLSAADLLLSRLGNFPGRQLLRDRYFKKKEFSSTTNFALERIAREAENTIEKASGEEQILTDFQFDLFSAVTEGRSVSVSAPTSAGKSFVLNLALERKLSEAVKESIVYIVPTRALISEVSLRIRVALRKSKLINIVVRTAPFPVRKEAISKGIVYILTQERLMSLLYSEDEGLWITSLIIDEAHEIQKGKRGIVLQNSIDGVLAKFPGIPVLFASPLISNPEYFLKVFGVLDNVGSLVERLSPVSQNIVLVDAVKGATNKARFSIVLRNEIIELGERVIDFKFRGSKTLIKALLAVSLTREGDSTIIFANGPADTEKISECLAENLDEAILDDDVDSFIDFIKTEIHPEYPLIECLSKGVAFHYGYMPSIVRSNVERFFKEEKLNYICCTSTLLQGVNLPAKNIIIDKPKSGDKPMARPDFLNLSGRAGRLLKEFHGNIWCLKPAEWDEPVYKGEQLEKIKTAIDVVMSDGGSLVHDLLEKRIKDDNEKEGAEAAFSRIFHEVAQNGRDAVLERYGNDSNHEELDKTIGHCESINVTLPYSILEAHKSLRPDHLQSLYTKFLGELFLPGLKPLHPFKEGAKNQFELILSLISKYFEWEIHENYFPFLSYLAYEWVRGTSLGEILGNRVSYVRGKDPEKSVSPIIRETLNIIEHDIRFKLEKYFAAYVDILKYVFEERGLDQKENSVEPYHIYLEFGASDKVSLNLMALGLSRFTALRVSKYKIFKSIEDDKAESYFIALSNIALRNSILPEVCKKEILDIVGE